MVNTGQTFSVKNERYITAVIAIFNTIALEWHA